jgi:hypothetical protein
MNLESAVLILRTSDATTNVNTFGSNVTWSNINLKALLGSMYNKYSKFKICLTSYGNYNGNAIAVNTDRYLQVYFSGFNWINQGYMYSVNGNTNSAMITTIDVAGTAGRSINYSSDVGNVFYMNNQSSVDLTITFARISDNVLNNAQNYGNSVFAFVIYGIE